MYQYNTKNNKKPLKLIINILPKTWKYFIKNYIRCRIYVSLISHKNQYYNENSNVTGKETKSENVLFLYFFSTLLIFSQIFSTNRWTNYIYFIYTSLDKSLW